MWKKDMCTIWLMILCFLSTLPISNASVNTSRYPNVKNTRQSSTYESFTSVKAVDGSTNQHFSCGCCSHTAVDKSEAWWQIDLQGLIVIEHVKIYYRDDINEQRSRFGGYQIYQSNTSDWRNGYLCHRDTTSTSAALSLTPRITCTGSNWYLTIYSDRRSIVLPWYSDVAFLELCEVEVYGCPLGKFGNGNCDSDCGKVCANSLCDPVTGECTYCVDGYYKTDAICKICSSNCFNDVCNAESGVCSACTPGHYGSHCNLTCPFNCKDSECLQSNAQCEDCQDGFFGPSCDACSAGCTNPVCDKISGNCIPCLNGFHEMKCNKLCSPNCANDTCTQLEGKCIECDLGFHGSMCDRTCPTHCKDSICVQDSGVCSGCTPGYHGGLCDKACPSNCKNKICAQHDNACLCCVSGYHGGLCDKPCPSNCKNHICDQQDNACFVNTSRYPNVKNTSQSSTYSATYTSVNAVDGSTSQDFSAGSCSHTAVGKSEAWWQIDLQGQVVMECVKIYYRDELDEQKRRFGGYQIYQSNTSDWRNGGYLCHKDTTSTYADLSLTPRITCTGSARYLTIYSDRRSGRLEWYSTQAILELCEVEVYGCPLGKFGNGNCDLDCDVVCANSLCDPVTGECASCIPGRYGNQCDLTCPFNCKDNICLQSSGQCEDCEDGFFGLSCDACSGGCVNPVCDKKSGTCSSCLNGFYDVKCDKLCSHNCTNDTCTQLDGKCIECDLGFHGSICDMTCPTHCKYSACVQDSGVCTECDLGFHGSICDKTCPTHCKYSTCVQDSGVCAECDLGFHGSVCDKTCPTHCKDKSCFQQSGVCTECDLGFFGSVCVQNCSVNCKNNTCNQDSGICYECVRGFHSTDCNQTCPTNCRYSICARSSGECSACESGLYGLNCNMSCSAQCNGDGCYQNNGTCTGKAMSTSDDKTGTYAGAGVGAVVAIALVVIATVVIVRRRRLSMYKENSAEGRADKIGNVDALPVMFNTPNKQTGRKSTCTSSEDGAVYVNYVDPETDDVVIYNNVDVTNVSIHELRSIIDSKMADKAAAFQEEFQTYPWGAVHPHEAGKKSSNKQKNRFKTTFPYDHSRIVLDVIGKDIDTAYINANDIDGIGKEQVYIASQGPKPNTLDDFWRMVWQVNTGKIVMLTNLVEGSSVKCHKYWPEEGESLVTQTFELKLDRERTYAFYVIRDISIVVKKTKAERQVHQFHLTTWPDHGTPDTLELVLFNRRVTSYQTQLPGQMVVHCSAGIGRTGTFIGLDALLTHGKNTGHVDIPKYIRTMRKDRMNMIQTYEQYIALHELLVEGFNLQDTHIFRTNFPTVLTTMCPTNKPANQTKIHQEFKVLQTCSSNQSPSCFKAASLPENKDKNRNKDILAADKFRAFLQSQLPNRTDYINAIMIQSHTSRSGYLMTQFPLENTVDDFWTMVCDYSCENIVVLGQPTEECWLRQKESGDTATGNAFSVKKLHDRSPNSDLAIGDYEVIVEGSSNETVVRIFSMPNWSSDSLLPPSDSSLLQLLEQLDSRRRSDNTRPVVVMCRDGCTQSGLFCCISNIRDQMKMDEEVDIFQTSRQLKSRRPEALGSIKQYQYCYTILGQYLDSTDVYIN